MSSIKDLLEEEKEAEGQLKNAQQQAEAILRDARTKAGEQIRSAQSDDALVKELTARNKERISALQQKIFGECEARAADTERLCRKNLEAAVRLVVENVMGVRNER
jgi:vacuolar-type H+-ATPase subunit H